MRFIEPNVEWWPQKTTAQQIAKVGRICYKAEGKQPSADMTDEEKEKFIEDRDEKRASDFWESGHKSMMRHGSVYYYIPNENSMPLWLWSAMTASPYISYNVQKKSVWISTNMQYVLEHPKIAELLQPYIVSENKFIMMAMQKKFVMALMLLRMTMVVTTQISTTRELNRTSPNSIAEQSTRYVNMEKKGGVQVCEPHWRKDGTRWQRLAYWFGCKVSEWMYRLLLKSGLKPEDARGVLPLDAYTVAAYTYDLREWKNIMNLRYHGTTGRPHPNAHIVAEKIADIINERMRVYVKDFEI